MTMEFAMGRASQKSSATMYKVLEPRGSKWHLHGIVTLLGCYLLMMFYTTVAAWMLQYFVDTARGVFVGQDKAGVEAIFGNMQSEPGTMILYMLVVVLIGFGVCSFGVQKGLERITKIMMLALLAIMVVLAINSIFMDGGKEGLSFYLFPDLDKMKEVGVGTVIVSAMNQAFFTLSLGMGAMAIFGSYIGKERALMGEAVNVALLDTFVAFTSGLIIFPACFAFNVAPNNGPGLIFVTLPNIFNHMAGGRVWGSLFFVFMSFAALSTVLAVFEQLLSCTMELFGWSRKKACLINGVAMFVLSLPCILGFNVWKELHPLGADSNIMDLEDFLVSNILLPLGSLIFVLFCTIRYGWGWNKFMEEANEGRGLKVAKWMRPYMTFVLPLLVLTLLVLGIVDYF
jgi:NSS family neurotransmitter:Na+ symporter